MIWALFWILALVFAAGAAAYATRPLWRDRAAAPSRAAHDVSVFKSQLAEVDRDLARGVLSDAEAEGARREISRRLLAADAEAQAASAIEVAPKNAAQAGLLAAAAPMAVGAFVVYLLIGAPGVSDAPLAGRSFQAELETRYEQRLAADPALKNRPKPDPDERLPNGQKLSDLLPRLEAKVAQTPNDPRGHELLGRVYMSQERYAEAWRSLERAIKAAGPSEASLTLLPMQGEAMVLAAGGVVSPEAEAVFRRAPKADRSRYFLGLALVQRGAIAAGVNIWQDLLRDTENPALARSLRPQIAAAAREAGLSRGGTEGAPPPRDDAPAGSASGAPAPGPSADDVAAAADMSPEERREMIAGMLDRLSDRLKDNPDDIEGWVRLIRSRRTFGQPEKAREDYARAKTIFAEDPAALERLARAAGNPAREPTE